VAGWAWPGYKDPVVACRRCGAAREDGDRFCADCGVPLGRGAVTVMQAAEPGRLPGSRCRQADQDCVSGVTDGRMAGLAR
jgi:hypothetical protein